MTDLLLDITQYLISKGIAQEDGVDIFQNHTPEQPDEVVILSEYTGLPSAIGIETVVRSLQIKVRSTSSEAARIKAWSIFNLLDDTSDVYKLIGNQRLVMFHPRSLPLRLTVDTEGRVTWYFNMGVTTNKEI